MQTLIMPVSEQALNLAAKLLLRGEVIAIPTDTVYGLAAVADDDKAMQKVYEIKQRDKYKPLIRLISDMNMLPPEITKRDYDFAEHSWFNAEETRPLTIIFRNNVSYRLIKSERNKFTHDLISKAGIIAAPSANTQGMPDPLEARDVFFDLHGKIPLIIDGGTAPYTKPSRIVKFIGGKERVVRE